MGLFEEKKIVENWRFISNLLEINRWFFKKIVDFLGLFLLAFSSSCTRAATLDIFAEKSANHRNIDDISPIFGQFFPQSIISGRFHFDHIQYPIFRQNIDENSQFFKPWFWHIKHSLILLHLKMGLDFSSEKK